MKVKISATQFLGYGVLAVIVMIIVYGVASSYLNPQMSVSVSMKSLTPTSTSTYPYFIQKLAITVNNTGSSSISGMVLTVYLAGKPLRNFNVNLPPHSWQVVNSSYLIISNGTYNFQAVADPGQVLNIKNRATTTGNFSVLVLPAERPDVYTSVSNKNITSTESFTLQPYGVAQALYASNRFNLSLYRQITNNADPIVFRVFSSLFQAAANVNGAYVTYSNSSSSYVAWMQGLVNLTLVRKTIVGNGITVTNATFFGVPGIYATAQNRSGTSFCAFAINGWTKIIEYTNSSSPTTCKNVLSTKYNSTQTAVFVNYLKKNPALVSYQGKFVYINSSGGGSALIYNSTQNTIASMSLFYNRFGFFGSYIKRNNPPYANFAGYNVTCWGPTFSSGNTSVCTLGVNLLKGVQWNASTVMTNSTEVNVNYTAHLYSLVNSSYMYSSAGSAQLLISSLGFNGLSAQWNSNIKSTCSFNVSSGSIPCVVNGFAPSPVNGSRIANITITNRLSAPMTVNGYSCIAPGWAPFWQKISKMIAVNQSATMTAPCAGLQYVQYVPTINWVLGLNYTIGGKTTILNGTAVTANR